MGHDDYARKPWDRASKCQEHGVPAFGAVIIGERISGFNKQQVEMESLINAVKHARKDTPVENSLDAEGIKYYYLWTEEYANSGKERGMADVYCHSVYSSVRKAAVIYLRGLASQYLEASDYFQYAAACFDREVKELDKAIPYISWDSPWGIDEERSRKLAPILRAAAGHYEKGIEYLEKILQILNISII